ncbi:MAG: peptidase S8, partial [Leptolyngbya sp. SIO4C1]|nr:peptidase S8 [Leptolyngbya sp. SIO4C1]
MQSRDRGVLPGQEGIILQRGGEELQLQKVSDRLTTRLSDPDRLETLRTQLRPRSVRPVARGQLIEWQIAPTQLEAALQQARQSETVAFASHVYHLIASPQTFVYLLDQLTVQFAPETKIVEVDAIAAGLGLLRDKA